VVADSALNNSGGRLFVWQQDAALIVGIDAMLIAGLVGATVWRARRR
jgi:hypothetical protein